MKMTVPKLKIALISLLSATSAHAGPGISTQMTITQIGARDAGTDVSGTGFNNPYPCTNTSTFRIENGVNNGDMMRATILTARSLNQPVRVWVSGCSADGVSITTAVWMD